MTLVDPTYARQFEQLPPHDVDAEAAVVSALALGDASIRAAIRSTVGRGDFFQTDHQILFDIVCHLIDRGGEVDIVLVRAELEKRKLLDEIGGTEFLAQVITSMPSAFHGQHYAEIVRERSVRRQMIALSNDILRECYQPSRLINGDEISQAAMDRLSKLITVGRAAEYWKLGDVVQEVFEDLDRQESPLITSGYPALDAEIGGVGEGEMVIVAARPSMGKSTLLRQMAVRIAKQGIPVGFLSLEEPPKKIARNVLSAEGMIENRRLRGRNLTREEIDGLLTAVSTLSSLPLYGSKNSSRRLSDIRALVTLWVAKHGIKVIFLDYLQRVQAPGERRYEQVTNASLELSNLWKDTGVRAIVAAQLSRSVEGRDDKRPTMSDLRESGQIEQDADGIVFLHREDYYHLEDDAYEQTHVAELIIAKWRDAARGKVVRLRSNLRFQTFEELSAAAPSVPANLVQFFEDEVP